MSLGTLVIFVLGLGLGVALTFYLLQLEDDDDEKEGSGASEPRPAGVEASAPSTSASSGSSSSGSADETEPEGADEDELEAWMKETFDEHEGPESAESELGASASTDVRDESEGTEETKKQGSLKERSSLNRGTIEQTVEKGAFAKDESEGETGEASPGGDEGPRGAERGDRETRETRDLDSVSSGSTLSEQSLADRLEERRSEEASETEESEVVVDHWLEGIGGSVAGDTYRVGDGIDLGRDASNDIQVTEGGVSREHCRFRTDGEHLVVEDLGSTNGTLLNGRRLEAGERYQLESDDLVEAAGVSLLYHLEADFEEDACEKSGEVAVLSSAAATVEVDNKHLREQIDEELERVGGDVEKAADILNMDPEAVRRLASSGSVGSVE